MNTTFLIGVQATTNKAHWATATGKPVCGTSSRTRYGLFVKPERGGVEEITCSKCLSLASKKLAKES